MLFIHVESVNARNAELRRAADQARRHRTPRIAYPAPVPQPPRRRARRSWRASAVAAAARTDR